MHTKTITLLPLLLAAAAAPSLQAQEAKGLSGSRPNIIFIFSDDHAAHAISAYGSRINQTPHIDRLAKEGMLFRNVFCGNSICGPSRATILTGKHCHAHGFMRNGNRFDGSQTTFPKLLRSAGYQTAIIGKWHLTSDPVGFDHWMVLPGQGQYYNPDFITAEGRKRYQGHATDLTTQFSLEWLEEKRDKNRPFVLMCQHKAPHRAWEPGPEELGMYRDADIPEPATLFDDYQGRGPATTQQEMEIDRHMYMFYDLKLEPTEAEKQNLQGPDRWWEGFLKRMTPAQRSTWDKAFAAENAAFRKNPPKGRELVRWKYQRYIKNYLRCVAGVDKGVGKILDYVDSKPELRENTIVIYCSDQGFYLGDHGWYDKRWMYEESLRMPFLVRWPERIAAGKEVSKLGQNIDFAPTFLDLAGVEAPADMHGVSLVPLLEGKQPEDWRDAIYYHYYESHAVHMCPAHYGIRTERFKLIYYYEPDRRYWEFFDLQEDPDELRNAYREPRHQELIQQLKQRLQEMRQKYQDDTGVLGQIQGKPSFTVTAGIARAARTDGGWELRANARGGYALKPLSPAIDGEATLRCDIRAVPGKPSRGYLIVTGGKPRARLIRAGIDFGRQRLQIFTGGVQRPTKAVALELEAGKAVTVSLHIDLAARQLTARAAGKELQVPIPKNWPAITYGGYGSSDGEAHFTDIELER